MNVLVTGAAGFVGGHLARFAAARGCVVVGIGGAALDADAMARRGLRRHIEGEIDERTLQRLHVRPDLVMHCAGGASVAASVADPDLDRRRTVGSTAALIAHLDRAAPGARLVYPSSGAVYGAAAGEAPRSADAPLAPVSPYGQHKAEAEALVRTAGAAGRPIAIVRLFSIYGPGLRKQLLFDACRRFESGGLAEFGGTGAERRDFLEISDAIALLWRAGEMADPSGPVADGGAGAPVSTAELLSRLARHFPQAPSIRFNGQDRPGDPAAMQACTRVAASWGFAPRIGLEKGLARYAAWYLDNRARADEAF